MLYYQSQCSCWFGRKKYFKLESAVATVFEDFRIDKTKVSKHATELAKKACMEGFDIIISVGGDGTCHEVINGLIEDDQLINPDVTFAIVPIGTGSDLIKSLHTPKDLLPLLRYAAFGEKRILDVGKALSQKKKAHSSSMDGISKETKYFLNVAGFGANGGCSTSQFQQQTFGWTDHLCKPPLTYNSPKARLCS